MSILVIGLMIFIGVHSVPSFSTLRLDLIARIGEGSYKAAFAVIALVGLVLIIVGKAYADFVPLWQPPAWGRHITFALMLPALALFAAANMPTNIKRITRHPMLWGVTLWAVGHMLANGDFASVLLFGTFGAYALLDMWSANNRGASKSEARFSIKQDAAVVGAGTVVYALFAFLHPYMFGVAII